MGLDKSFIEKAFYRPEDRVNRAIFVKPEELIELSDEDLSFFGEGIFYCLPRSKFVESHKDEIREKYNLSNEMPKINGIYLGTFVKMRAWDKIRKTKPTLKEIISIARNQSTQRNLSAFFVLRKEKKYVYLGLGADCSWVVGTLVANLYYSGRDQWNS